LPYIYAELPIETLSPLHDIFGPVAETMKHRPWHSKSTRRQQNQALLQDEMSRLAKSQLQCS